MQGEPEKELWKTDCLKVAISVYREEGSIDRMELPGPSDSNALAPLFGNVRLDTHPQNKALVCVNPGTLQPKDIFYRLFKTPQNPLWNTE